MPRSSQLASIETIIADARAGRMFILVDDEDRENEGDLVIPAQMAGAEAINFMAKHGRGLICLALARERVERLQLPLMARHNQARHSTAFTVSIEAREGVTTGISAADRARTIAVAIDPQKSARDIVSPGHVFPLAAQEGGVLVRAGHTEAAVDIARLAGLIPAGVICEIMNDDGSMARLPDLMEFAKNHGLNIATIADLIAYRRRSEKLVACVAEQPFESVHGGAWKLRLYVSRIASGEHVALIKGDLPSAQPVWVRMHALDVLHDVLGEAGHAKTGELHAAMRMIGKRGEGAVVLLQARNQGSGIRGQEAERGGRITGNMDHRITGNMDHRIIGSSGTRIIDYGIGAQILLDLSIKDMVILSNTRKTPVGLEGYGLNIVGYEKIA